MNVAELPCTSCICGSIQDSAPVSTPTPALRACPNYRTSSLKYPIQCMTKQLFVAAAGSHALCVCTCDLLPWLPEEGWHARRVRQGAAPSAYLHTWPDNQRCECGPTIMRKTGFYQKACHFSFCLCIYFRFSETPSSFCPCFRANTKMFAEGTYTVYQVSIILAWNYTVVSRSSLEIIS